MSSDAHSGSIMQLTSEAETSKSTTHGSLNTQNNTLIQDNSVEYGDTLQLGLTSSVNNQTPATGSVSDDNVVKNPLIQVTISPINLQLWHLDLVI